MRKLLLATAIVSFGGLSSSGALAATVTGTECAESDVMIDGKNSTECVGLIEIDKGGSAGVTDINDAFDGDDFVEVGQAPNEYFDIDIGSTTGTFTIFDIMAGTDYVLAFKAAADRGVKYFAAYLLSSELIAMVVDPGDDLEGTFSTDAFSILSGGDNAPGLSNAVLFKRDGDLPPPPPPPYIPLPAAGWMMLAGLGGLAALRRRRKS